MIIYILAYLVVGFAAARVTRKIYPANMPDKIISERHQDYCPRSPDYDKNYKILRQSDSIPERWQDSPCRYEGKPSSLCSVKVRTSDYNNAMVISSLFFWPILGLSWLLLTDRIIPKRLSEAEKMQIEFDNNPRLKAIHDELMEQYRLG